MRTPLLFLLTLFAVVPAPTLAADPSTAAAASKAPEFKETLASAEHLAALRQGGYVLYLRHGHTDNTRPDRATGVDLQDCSTQRPLNDEGRTVAARVGEALRKARIPLAEIRISPLCRVRDTVAAAGLPKDKVTLDPGLMYPGNLTSAQKAPIVAHTRQLLSEPVAAGGNRLLVAHAPNLMELIGYFPKEATLVIFRPGGAGFDYVASIPPARWADLLR